eukprot:TRINITY_DN4621_c0_g1_i2.p2 TRINITY_DN4621_c0_g1~~TRINITY_DN4621_c0_g1_i2.p2  ORF type:complete len:189 (+),score=65.07 TRINITY_DN4621_c0_g1_i2:71-568(+)
MDALRRNFDLSQQQIAKSIQTLTGLHDIIDENLPLLKNLEAREAQLAKAEEQLKKEKEEFMEERLKWEKEINLVCKYNKDVEDIIELNVGGTVVETTRTTLTSVSDSMLAAMFSGRHELKKDNQGRYFLDRDPEVFKYVLSFLRTKTIGLPSRPGELSQVLVGQM